MRFRELSSNLLYDCKLMDTGVIVRQCHPFEHNIQFLEFEDFIARYEVSYVAVG